MCRRPAEPSNFKPAHVLSLRADRVAHSILSADTQSGFSASSVDEILHQPNLAHMRETISEDYEEFFDA